MVLTKRKRGQNDSQLRLTLFVCIGIVLALGFRLNSSLPENSLKSFRNISRWAVHQIPDQGGLILVESTKANRVMLRYPNIANIQGTLNIYRHIDNRVLDPIVLCTGMECVFLVTLPEGEYAWEVKYQNSCGYTYASVWVNFVLVSSH